MCIITDGAILFLKTDIACYGEILIVGFKKGYTPHRRDSYKKLLRGD